MIALCRDFDCQPEVNLIAAGRGRGTAALIWKDLILLCMYVCVCVRKCDWCLLSLMHAGHSLNS